MLRISNGSMGLLVLLSGCISDYGVYSQYSDFGRGGSYGLLLPFKSGEYWLLTQGYGSNDSEYRGSHKDYGFSYGNDTYALDFTQYGCEAYGKAVTPMDSGVVIQVGVENGSGDQGYGNNVLVEHPDGRVSRYGHLSELWVSLGDELDTNDTLGLVGNTGYTVGTACPSYPGTHLHVALYQENEATIPEPLSGQVNMQEYCWYNREGNKDCNGDPGDYTPVNDDSNEESGGNENTEQDEEEEANDDETSNNNGNTDDEYPDEDLDIELFEMVPEDGTAEETEFIWVAVVNSPYEFPEVMLSIYNPNDSYQYLFQMETESEDSPYVFTYRKDLQDDDTDYEYWVEVETEDEREESPVKEITVEDGDGDVPTFESFGLSPASGEADETVFTWSTTLESEDEPEVWLIIANAVDATLYSFEMEVDWNGDEWYASYSKSLRDPAIYTYWMVAENRSTTNTGDVLTVETY